MGGLLLCLFHYFSNQLHFIAIRRIHDSEVDPCASLDDAFTMGEDLKAILPVITPDSRVSYSTKRKISAHHM